MASNPELPDGGRGKQSQPLPIDPHDGARTTSQLHTQRAGQTIVLNQYERLKRIGAGQHGEVYVAWNMNTESLVAIKGMKRKNPREDKMKLLRKSAIQASPHTPLTDRLGTTENKIRKEIAIMKKCRHAHVVRLLEVIDDRMKHKIYMVMEFLGGGEIKWRNLKHEPILHVDQARRICRDAILGLEYLHYQGIIHRDIKPANLLWTDDRQQVKISDFGVSHFSVALRMAAAGSGQAALDYPSDPRLMNDNELSKRAGTPSFYAPEIIHEYKQEDMSADNESGRPTASSGNSNGGRSTSSLHLPLPKLPVTKAIDVWALGVTLYCLLFGHVPFHYSGDNAFRTYVLIANADWGVEDTMGFDRIPTSGRYPQADDESEGAVVVRILDKMLQKDVGNRMTLDQFKSHPWITRDIPDVGEWLRETSPSKNDMVMVTDMETKSAMSDVRFRQGWHQRWIHRLSTILHTVRSHRSTRSFGQTSDEKFGSDSAPHIWGDRHKQDKHHGSTKRKKGKKVDHKSKDKGKAVVTPDKGKGRAKNRPKTARNESGSTVVSTSASRTRRGSDSLVVPVRVENVTHSTETSSPLSGRIGDDHIINRKQRSDRTLGRIFLPLAERWLPQKSTSHESTPPNASTSTLSSSTESYSHGQRYAGGRSTETIPDDTGRFSPVRFAPRAASVPEFTDMEDVLSINSGRDDDLDCDAIMLGAGGVATGPVYGTPAYLTAAVAAASNVASTSRQSQPDRLLISNFTSATSDPTSYDTTFARQAQIRSQAASPLVHMAYGSDIEHDNAYEEGSDDSLSYGEVVEGQYRGGPYTDVLSTTSSEIYEEVEVEDSDEESAPIEIRRRRPSVAVTTASPSSPSNRSPL